LEDTGKDIQQQAEEDSEAVDKAVNEAQKQIGNQPGGTNIILKSAKKQVFIQKATYEEIFADYLTDPLSSGKRTYLRPARRQIAGGMKLKGKYPKKGKTNRLTHLVYALDVSGSVTSKERLQFISSAKTLKEKLKPKLMTVMLWDTSIKFEKTFREDESIDNIKSVGGGGTSLGPVYNRVAQLNPEALVIFTDLQVSIPPQPKWETIWFVPYMHVHETYIQAVQYGEIYLIPEL